MKSNLSVRACQFESKCVYEKVFFGYELVILGLFNNKNGSFFCRRMGLFLRNNG